MIRITGGEFRGRKLKTPEGLATRPTPSRVREGLFDVLGQSVIGCEFFDLYAGSGAVGFEALSRGARSVVFVEASRRAVAAIRQNLDILSVGDRARLVTEKVPVWIESGGFRPEPPTIVFADPPYREGLDQKTLLAIAQCEVDWGADSICVIQTEKEGRLAESCGPWVLRKRYAHGDSALWVYDPR